MGKSGVCLKGSENERLRLGFSITHIPSPFMPFEPCTMLRLIPSTSFCPGRQNIAFAFYLGAVKIFPAERIFEFCWLADPVQTSSFYRACGTAGASHPLYDLHGDGWAKTICQGWFVVEIQNPFVRRLCSRLTNGGKRDILEERNGHGLIVKLR